MSEDTEPRGEIVLREEQPATALAIPLPTMEEIAMLGGIAKTMAGSGYFKDARGEQQAMAKMLIARELGISPIKGLTDIHVIEGRPQLSANLIAAFIKSRPGYDFDILEHDDEKCVIQFYRDHKPTGKPVKYDAGDAAKAKLIHKDNWKSDPSSMLFARCITRGMKRRIPEVTGGMALYSEGEIEAQSPQQLGPSSRREQRLEQRAEQQAAPEPTPEAPAADPRREQATADGWEPSPGEMVRHVDYPDRGPWPVKAVGTDSRGTACAQLDVGEKGDRVVPYDKLMPDHGEDAIPADLPWSREFDGGEEVDGEPVPEEAVKAAERLAEEVFSGNEADVVPDGAVSSADFAPAEPEEDVAALKVRVEARLREVGETESMVAARLRGAKDNAELLKGLLSYADKKAEKR